MSMESAQKFYEKLKGDVALIERLNAMSEGEKETFVKDELGYDFTHNEMQEILINTNPGLTDEDLEAIVGGTSEFWDAAKGAAPFGFVLGVAGGAAGAAA